MAFSLSNNISPLVFSSAFAELTFETDLISVRFSLQDNSNDKTTSEQAEQGATEKVDYKRYRHNKPRQ